MKKDKKILILEDEPTIRSAVCDQLYKLGELLEARGFATASRQITTAQPEEIALAVVDIRIGQPDGFQVIEYLGRQPNGLRTPVIVLTVFNDLETLNRSMAFPSVKYLINKPWNSRCLIKAAVECLKGRAVGFKHLDSF